MEINNKNLESSTSGTNGKPTFFSHTHACASEASAPSFWGLDHDDDLSWLPDGEVLNDGSDPLLPLPILSQEPDIWPEPLQAIVNQGQTPTQRDILLLGALDVLGATLSPKVRTLYDGKWLSPNLMLFVVAPPASGKGVLAWLRQIALPYHNELAQKYKAQYDDYRVKKVRFDSMGKERATIRKEDIPEPPVRRFFLIPANNSGTGIQANIIHSGGRGLIFCTEADTLTSALNTDYGHFDDALRNIFDHVGLQIYRRTGDESMEVESTYVSVLLSGTPDQVKPLIGSYANGLASRFAWYYCPPVKKWESQFVRTTDMNEWARQLGLEWKKKMDALKHIALLTFELTEMQQEQFDIYMSVIFDQGHGSIGIEAVSTIIRLAPQLLRIMSIVALLRIMESSNTIGDFAHSELIRPADDIPIENVSDGIIPRYVYGINDADFLNCLMLGHPLFRHAMHVLSLLPAVELANRGTSDKEALFSAMNKVFTRKELLDKAGEMGINPNTAQQWLKRAMKMHLVVKVNHGTYKFTSESSL